MALAEVVDEAGMRGLRAQQLAGECAGGWAVDGEQAGQGIIAAHPELREREPSKFASLSAALARTGASLTAGWECPSSGSP